MAKKKPAKKGAPKKKAAARKGAPAMARKTKPVTRKKKAGAGRPPSPPGHHRRMRLGLTKNGRTPPIHVGNDRRSVFKVYGDSIGPVPGGIARREVHLSATMHTWEDPAHRVTPRGNDALEIEAYCYNSFLKKMRGGGSDDLTVTITLDGTDETVCEFDDVDYDA